MQRFGEKLGILRARRSLSYRKLATLLEISHSHLVKIEKGKHLPSVGLVVKIAEVFNVSFDQLMNDKIELDD